MTSCTRPVPALQVTQLLRHQSRGPGARVQRQLGPDGRLRYSVAPPPPAAVGVGVAAAVMPAGFVPA